MYQAYTKHIAVIKSSSIKLHQTTSVCRGLKVLPNLSAKKLFHLLSSEQENYAISYCKKLGTLLK
jgi:hypothetical protein